MFKRLISAALVFGAAALAPPAMAQSTVCMPRDALTASLQTKYSETLGGGGLQSAGRLIELWRSVETGTFTIILTRPNGTSCVLASGAHWYDALAAPDGVAG